MDMKIFLCFACLIIGSIAIAISSNEASSANGSRLSGGGAVSSVSLFPFNAAVYHLNGFLCGGVLISNQWVLTTAECVYAYAFEKPLHTYVELGGLRINSGPEAGKILAPLDEIVIHPDFHQYQTREEIYYNNVALLKMQFRVTPSPTVQPIALPDPADEILAGTVGIVTGWGGRIDTAPSPVLEFVLNAVVKDLKQCRAATGIVIEETSFCTEASATTTACKYDHGSPIFRTDANLGYVLQGIVNYAPCAATFYPTIYSNVPKYVFWINTYI